MPISAEGRRVQERGLTTRAALLDAAVECLVERGHAATTTIEVARRAGVSRGAQLHHFPTRAALLSAAVEHMCDLRAAEFRRAFAALPPGLDRKDRVDATIDILWSLFRDPTFAAWVEQSLACRSDPDLRDAVVALNLRFVEESRAELAAQFPPVPGADPALDELGRSFVFVVMDGLALRRLVPHDHDVAADEIVGALKAIARSFAPVTPEESP